MTDTAIPAISGTASAAPSAAGAGGEEKEAIATPITATTSVAATVSYNRDR